VLPVGCTLDLIYKITSPEVEIPLESILEIICNGNRRPRALLRQYALGSAAFRGPNVLQRVTKSHYAAMLGLNRAAGFGRET
jgi:hypothetical protein